MLVAKPMTVVPAAKTAAAPMTHFSTTLSLSRSYSCFSSRRSIFNCITVIRVSCVASSPKSAILLNNNLYYISSIDFLSFYYSTRSFFIVKFNTFFHPIHKLNIFLFTILLLFLLSISGSLCLCHVTFKI